MKRSLPTAGKHARGHSSPAPARERIPLDLPVIAIAQATVGNVATTFASELVQAIVHEGLTVNALVTAEDSSADTQSALTQLLMAGATRVSIARVDPHAPDAALVEALSHFAADELLVVLGNALPSVYQPFFCAVVSEARTTHLPDARRLRILADLEMTSPSPHMVVELGKLIAHRFRQRAQGR